MTTIIFNTYDNTYLDQVNKQLYKNSKGRFKLCTSHHNAIKSMTYHMIDYDFNEIIRKYDEIADILSCFDLDFNQIKEDMSDENETGTE